MKGAGQGQRHERKAGDMIQAGAGAADGGAGAGTQRQQSLHRAALPASRAPLPALLSGRPSPHHRQHSHRPTRMELLSMSNSARTAIVRRAARSGARPAGAYELHRWAGSRAQSKQAGSRHVVRATMQGGQGQRCSDEEAISGHA